MIPIFSVVGCDGTPLGPDGRPDGGPGPVDPAAHCPARDVIECADDIGGQFPFTVRGDTLVTEQDGYDGSACGGGGTAVYDRAFRWTAPWAGRYVITTEGSNFDTILSLRQGSCGRELACNDDAADNEGSSELTLDLDDCETITIVVDGGRGRTIEGPFTLAIRGSEVNCEDGRDDDLDGNTDCDDDDCFTPACADPTEDNWPESLSTMEWTVLELSNQNREAGAVCDGETFEPAAPLEMDPYLRTAARLHSTDMAENSYFDHVSLDGREPSDRILATGFPGSFPLGENIARGQTDAEEVVRAWMESPGHCRNIMNPEFHALGVGLAENAGGEKVWTQNFAGGR